MVDIRTDKEILRDERHRKICKWWKENFNPERAPKYRFATVAAKTFDLTTTGIIKILKANNLYPED